MDLKTGIELVLRSLRGYRLPEPTRQADILVGEYRRGKVEPPEAQQQTLF
jgi:Ni/Co efflux regulator RcnB